LAGAGQRPAGAADTLTSLCKEKAPAGIFFEADGAGQAHPVPVKDCGCEPQRFALRRSYSIDESHAARRFGFFVSINASARSLVRRPRAAARCLEHWKRRARCGLDAPFLYFCRIPAFTPARRVERAWAHTTALTTASEGVESRRDSVPDPAKGTEFLWTLPVAAAFRALLAFLTFCCSGFQPLRRRIP